MKKINIYFLLAKEGFIFRSSNYYLNKSKLLNLKLSLLTCTYRIFGKQANEIKV